MGERLGYVVVTYNQASHRPELDVIGLHDARADAETERDELAAATARAARGERHVICEVVPVEEGPTS